MSTSLSGIIGLFLKFANSGKSFFTEPYVFIRIVSSEAYWLDSNAIGEAVNKGKQ